MTNGTALKMYQCQANLHKENAIAMMFPSAGQSPSLPAVRVAPKNPPVPTSPLSTETISPAPTIGLALQQHLNNEFIKMVDVDIDGFSRLFCSGEDEDSDHPFIKKGLRFEDIFTPAFNAACSKGLGNGLEESNVLKFACRKATKITIDALTKSDDPAIRSYAEFFAQRELVISDVTLPGYEVSPFTIDYQAPSQAAEIAPRTASEDAPDTAFELMAKQEQNAMTLELTALTELIAKAESLDAVTVTESGPVAAFENVGGNPEAAAVLRNFVESAKEEAQSSQLTEPKQGRKILGSKTLGRALRGTGKLFRKSKSINLSTLENSRPAKENVTLLSAWRIPTSKPDL